jgi:hypothetical protein
MKRHTSIDVRFHVELNPIVMEIMALINTAPPQILSDKKRVEMIDYLIPHVADVTADKKRFLNVRIETKEPL